MEIVNRARYTRSMVGDTDEFQIFFLGGVNHFSKRAVSVPACRRMYVNIQNIFHWIFRPFRGDYNIKYCPRKKFRLKYEDKNFKEFIEW